uniref:SAM domain-containing protein n=1 Tax=Macrostomum lignano TaxID=282301 RepID=A0A1I8F5A0_9PLAT
APVWPQIASQFLHDELDRSSALAFLSGLATKELASLPIGSQSLTSRQSRGRPAMRHLASQVQSRLQAAGAEPETVSHLWRRPPARVPKSHPDRSSPLLVIESRRLPVRGEPPLPAWALWSLGQTFAARLLQTLKSADLTAGQGRRKSSRGHRSRALKQTGCNSLIPWCRQRPKRHIAPRFLWPDRPGWRSDRCGWGGCGEIPALMLVSQPLQLNLSAAFGDRPPLRSHGTAAAPADAVLWRRAGGDSVLRCAALLCLPAASAAAAAAAAATARQKSHRTC